MGKFHFLIVPFLLTTLGISMSDMKAQIYFYGTTIVAIRTPQEILVGADSKVIAIGRQPPDAGTTCKIAQVGSLFFAHAGLIKDSWGTFNVPATVSQAQKKSDTILTTVNNFERTIADQLIRILEQIRREQPEYFQKHIDGGSAVAIAFFGVENEIPLLYVRYFVAKTLENGSVAIETKKFDCPGDCPTGITYAFLGEQSAINMFLDANPHCSRIGWVPTINKLIEVEAADKPDLVSLPIDILRIDKKGAAWIQKKIQCPRIEKY